MSIDDFGRPGALRKFFTESRPGVKWATNADLPPLRNLPPGARAISNEQLEQLTHTYDFRARVFDLSQSEDMRQYMEVMDRIVAGIYRQHHVDRYRSGPNAPVVYLEWVEIYGELENTTGVFCDPRTQDRVVELQGSA